MASYVTRQGDTMDLICKAYYGTERGGLVEAALEANPGLAERGPILPAGVTVTLPDLPKPATTKPLVRLWD